MKRALCILALLALVVLRIWYGFVVNQIFGMKYQLKKYKLTDAVYDETLEKRCHYGQFNDTLLVLNFNYPFYDNVILLKELYDGVFGRIISCGPPPQLTAPFPQPEIIYHERYGHLGYQCMALAMKKFPHYKGYLFANDDMIVNWWTMANQDKNKIWHGTQIVDWRQHAYSDVIINKWIWWDSEMGISACREYYNELKELAYNASFRQFKAVKALNVYLKNGNGSPRCGKGWSDFFYVPGAFSKQFVGLSDLAYKKRLFLEIAVHNILRSIDLVENILVVDGVYMPDLGKYEYDARTFWKVYNHQLAFIHPFKFHGRKRDYSMSKLKEVVRFKQRLTKC